MSSLAQRFGRVEFDGSFTKDSLRVFELDKEVLAALKVGDAVCFKGGAGQDAVLCTASATFQVTKVETSNTCLLAEVGDVEDEWKAEAGDDGRIERSTLAIVSSVACQHTVKRTAPKLHVVKQLLAAAPYSPGDSSDEEEEDGDGDDTMTPMYTEDQQAAEKKAPQAFLLSDLVDRVQASQAEIVAELRRLQAMEHNGRWQLLDTKFRDTLFDHVLDAINVTCERFEEVPADVIVEALQTTFPAFTIRYALQCLCDPSPTEGMWTLSPQRVALFRAVLCLRRAEGRMLRSKFLATWRESLGRFKAGVKAATMEVLKADVLVEGDGSRAHVILFQSSTLSPIPRRRFDQLFAIRKRWILPDLEPFVQPLVAGTVKLADLLLAFTRVTIVPDGESLYSARF